MKYFEIGRDLKKNEKSERKDNDEWHDFKVKAKV